MYGALKGQQFHSCDIDISFLFSVERKPKSTVRLYFGCMVYYARKSNDQMV